MLAGGGEVRVFADPTRVDVDQFAGCKVARGQLDDEGLLELALEQVHTVVHAAGGPLEAPDEVLDGLASVLSAAIGAGCRRLVFVSWLDAAPDAGNAYLAACAEAEELLAESPLEVVVLRRALTYGPDDPLTAAVAAGCFDARARHAPLWVEDLAAAVASADAWRGARDASPQARSHSRDVHLRLSLAGPEVLTLGAFAALLPDRAAPADLLPAHLDDLLARDTVPADDTLGRTATPPAAGAALLA